jgi:hypothetical protein
MAYGRQYMMDQLHRAGRALLDMDLKYANAIYDGTGGDVARNKGLLSHLGLLGRALPFSETPRYFNTSEYEALGGFGPRDAQSQRFGRAMDAGLMGANFASRYLLPAGGVTLAGKGIYDLTQGLYATASATPMFGGPEDGAQPGQLPLN